MAKTGMKQYVNTHKDPTYSQALGNLRKENRLESKDVQMTAARLMLTIRKEAKAAGYEIWCDLKIRHRKSGAVYVSKSRYLEE